MIAGVVFTTLTRIRARAELVHCQSQRLVGLNTQGTKRHSASHEMLHNRLHALHLVERYRRCGLFPTKEIADKDRRLFLVDHRFPFLELLITAQTCGQLQVGDGLRVPGVLDAVLAPRELSLILQQCLLFGSLMQTDGIAGDLLQTDTADGTRLSAEVTSQQVFAQSDALENLRTTIRADGRDTHLRHDLLQAFVDGLDIVLLSRSIFLLNLTALHQIVEDGEGHVRTQRTCTIAQQQRCVHRLTNLTALHNQRRLHTLTHADQIVMHSRDSQQRRNRGMLIVDVAITQDDVVHALVHAGFSLMAKVVESLSKTLFALFNIKKNR